MVDIPIWKTLQFKDLRCSFDTLPEYLRQNNIAYYGPSGNIRAQGSVSPKGAASLALLSTEDLGLSRRACSYYELLGSVRGTGLIPARPAIAPQLLMAYVEQPDGELVHIASDPKKLRYDPSVSFAVFGIARGEVNFLPSHQYLAACVLHDPDVRCNFLADALWVFELE